MIPSCFLLLVLGFISTSCFIIDGKANSFSAVELISTSDWHQRGAQFNAGDATTTAPYQGYSVSLSGNRNTAFIGVSFEVYYAGGVWFWNSHFQLKDPHPVTQVFQLKDPQILRLYHRYDPVQNSDFNFEIKIVCKKKQYYSKK